MKWMGWNEEDYYLASPELIKEITAMMFEEFESFQKIREGTL